MRHEALRREVWKANVDIVEAGLVELTWGNASGVDREAGIVAIKPSGLDVGAMLPEDIVLVSLETGQAIGATARDNSLRPSSDTPTHLHLYRTFPSIGGIVHTHSTCAVSWAQAGRALPCFGTTHADHFLGDVPVTRPMTPDEIQDAYEHHTGVVIAESFARIDPMAVPAVLVRGHGPFAWGASVGGAVENAIVLEAVARMALQTLAINPAVESISEALLDKHFFRKHGPGAYYGQRDGPDDA